MLFGLAMLFFSYSGVLTVECAALSVYRPGDGYNSGKLACGGRFTYRQRHVAVRRWYKYGCGAEVLLLHSEFLWHFAKIRDAGPFGIYKPPLRGAVQAGRWRVWVKSRPPRGWKWRGAADLSWGLWLKLGRPAPLSRLCVVYYNKRRLHQLLRLVEETVLRAIPAFFR